MAHNPEFLKLVNDAKTRVQEIDLAGYLKMREAGGAHVLVDTREESEWAAGHVVGAVHLGKGIIERDIETKVLSRPGRLEGGRYLADGFGIGLSRKGRRGAAVRIQGPAPLELPASAGHRQDAGRRQRQRSGG